MSNNPFGISPGELAALCENQQLRKQVENLKGTSKTAHQMFIDLGYRLDYSNSEQTVYRKKAENAIGDYCIVLDKSGTYKDYENSAGVATIGFGWLELNACVQWQKEQVNENGKVES